MSIRETFSQTLRDLFKTAESKERKRGANTVKQRAEKKAKELRTGKSATADRLGTKSVDEVLEKMRERRLKLRQAGVLPERQMVPEVTEVETEPDDYEKALQTESWKNLRTGVRELNLLVDSLRFLEKTELEILSLGVKDVVTMKELGEIEVDRVGILKQIEEFKKKNPEYRDLFYLLELRRLQGEGLKEIVSTSSTDEYRARIRRVMMMGKRGLLGGPTGAGKTVMAEMVAAEMKEEKIKELQDRIEKLKKEESDTQQLEVELKKVSEAPACRMVVGSKHTEVSEIVGHEVVRVVKVKEFTPEQIGEVIEYTAMINKKIAQKELERNAKFTEQEKADIQAILANANPFNGGGMETRFDMGPIYKCMEEGIPFILDEVNGLPPDVLLKLNKIMTLKIGEEYIIPENGGSSVKIKKGFSIICTGNFGDLYKGRSALDLSFVNRIDERIDVDYVKNTTDPTEDLGSESVMNSELFLIMLSKWMSGSREFLRGGGKAENDTLEVMWNFAKFVRYVQEISMGSHKGLSLEFRGAKESKKVNVSEFVKNPISMREVLNLLNAYLSNLGKGVPFEKYLLEHIFYTPETDGGHNAEYVSNTKRYIYYDLLTQFGFFKRLDGANDKFGNLCTQKAFAGDGISFNIDKQAVVDYWNNPEFKTNLSLLQGELDYLGGRTLVHTLVGEPTMERDYEALLARLPDKVRAEVDLVAQAAEVKETESIRADLLKEGEVILKVADAGIDKIEPKS